MKRIWTCIFLVLIFEFPHLIMGKDISCQLTSIAENNGLLGKAGEPPGPAILFSDSVIVPDFKLLFIDVKSKQTVVPKEVSIAYGWKWLMYPYPEHSWGVWEGASDIIECSGGINEIHVPEFEVTPRGWYNGKYVWFPYPRRPSFTGMAVVVKSNVCPHTVRAEITAKDARKLKGKSAEFNINCNGTSSIKIK